jgi:membrane-associated phospholipid phosphatase
MEFSKFFYKIGQHVIDSLKFQKGLNYILGIALTIVLVYSGFDDFWFRTSVSHPTIYMSAFASAVVGGLLPIVSPILIYLYGRARSSKKIALLGLMLGQAALLALLITSTMKVFTGRVAPDHPNGVIALGGFRFGINRGGAFSGWPSSHTAVAFATATALSRFYYKNKKVLVIAFTYAFFIALGVSLNIHWFSDVIAGSLIGYAVGRKIGIDYKKLVSTK